MFESFDDDDDIEVVDLNLDAEIVRIVREDKVRVPPFPSVAIELQQLIATDPNIQDASTIVQRDQALAAHVLRMASGSRFPTPVSTVSSALARIGMKELVGYALALGLKGEVEKAGPLAQVRRLLWYRGLASSVLCREMAVERQVIDPETALVCGLLSEFGKVAATCVIESFLDQHEHASALVLEDWLKIIDRYHAELALVLATKWGIPSPIAEVMTQSASDLPPDPLYAPAVDLVREAVATIDRHFRSNSRGVDIDPSHPLSRISDRLAGLVDVGASADAPDSDWIRKVEAPATPSAPRLPGVNASLGKDAAPCPVTRVDADMLTVDADRELQPNQVLRLVVSGREQTLETVTLVKSCQPQGGRFHIETKLFCASVQLVNELRELVQKAVTP